MKKLSNLINTVAVLIALTLAVADLHAQQVLPAPTNLTAVAKFYNQIDLSWQDNSGDAESGFEIFRDPGLGTDYKLLATVGKDVTTYQDQSVSPNSLYNYRVRAITRSQSSRFSNDASATTPDSPPKTPGDLSATIFNTNHVRLAWIGNNSAGVTFLVERANMTSGSSFRQIAVVDYDRTLTYEDKNLESGIIYCYRVMAMNASGTSGYSNTACAEIARQTPNAPARLSANAVSESRIDLSWADISDNETGFELQRSTDGRSFSKIADLGANVATYQNEGLTPSTRYWYRVRAKNLAGNSEFSNVADATTQSAPIVAPRPPSNLKASAVSGNQIDLSWTDNAANEDGFELERSEDGVVFSKIADPGASSTSFQDKSLKPATKYWYRVRAKNAGGFSSFSNVADATTPEVVPANPQRLSANAVSNTQIDLSWADLSTNETGFELQRSLDGNTFTRLTDLPANTSTYSNTGLATLTRYWYRVRAKNSVGNSGFSNEADATTFDVPPGAPVGLVAKTISSSQISLTWKDQATNEAKFELERSTDGATFTRIAEIAANTTTYENTGLAPATRYWYRVRSVNASGPSIFSNIANATTLDVIPKAPARLTAVTVNFEQINLSWEDLSGNETGFQIERSTNGTAFNKIADVGPNVKAYASKGLNSETRYYFRVRAINAIGFSAYSNVADATTSKAPIPDAPANLTAVPLDFDLVQLRWSALSANASEVIIERSRSKDKDFKQIGRQAASVIQFPDREILDVADYYYRIKAINAAGSSRYSNVAQIFAASIITATEPVRAKEQIYSANKSLFVQLSSGAQARITIYDAQGRKQKEVSAPAFSQTDLSNLASGIYIVVVETDQKMIRQKIALY